MELLDWIPSNKIYTHLIQSNPNAIDHIEKYNIPKVWSLLSVNPGAVRYLYHNPSLFNKGFWYCNSNPLIVPFIEKCMRKNEHWIQSKLAENPNTLHLVDPFSIQSHYYSLCKNTSTLAMQMIADCVDDLTSIHWSILSTNPSAIHIIEKNMHRIDWNKLSSNSSAIHILMQNPSRIDWLNFSKNTHPIAIEYMKQHLDKVNWPILSANPGAIELLKENKENISWYWLSLNPAIFEYNYPTMAKLRTEIIRDELISVALHPSRVCDWLQKGFTFSDF